MSLLSMERIMLVAMDASSIPPVALARTPCLQVKTGDGGAAAAEDKTACIDKGGGWVHAGGSIAHAGWATRDVWTARCDRCAYRVCHIWSARITFTGCVNRRASVVSGGSAFRTQSATCTCRTIHYACCACCVLYTVLGCCPHWAYCAMHGELGRVARHCHICPLPFLAHIGM